MIEVPTSATEEARGVFWDSTVRVVAIDLRGTLLRTPRVTALLPEMYSQGVPQALARAAQRQFDEHLRGPLQKRGDILDWTLFAARSMASTLLPRWGHGLDVAAMASAFRVRYLEEAERLLEPRALRQVVTALPTRFVVVADGPYEREAAALEAQFGTPRWMPTLITSECLGVNKLTSQFFVRLADRFNLSTRSIVVIGDRWDKDVAIPRLVGCRGILVGAAHQDLPAVGSLEALLLHPGEEVSLCAA